MSSDFRSQTPQSRIDSTAFPATTAITGQSEPENPHQLSEPTQPREMYIDRKLYKKRFIEFLEQPFVDGIYLDAVDRDMQTPTSFTSYRDMFGFLNSNRGSVLPINYEHLKELYLELYEELIACPIEVLKIFDSGANKLFKKLFPEADSTISVRPFNFETLQSMHDLNLEKIGQLVSTRGIITRCSSIMGDMISASYRCCFCNSICLVEPKESIICEPFKCLANGCGEKLSHELIHDRCKFVDKQTITLQQLPDDMLSGQIPTVVTVYARADLVDTVKSGDIVTMTGVINGTQNRVNQKKKKLSTFYSMSVDALHFKKSKAAERTHSPDELKDLSYREDNYDSLSESICPSIFGHSDVKKGVLLQLLGGSCENQMNEQNAPRRRNFRSDINILLVGDPGTGKSMILKYAQKLVPRSQYTSGKGSSGVGLTAYVSKDHCTNETIIKEGALLMCDGGLCCIDEFDKMSDSNKSKLHEIMENQTLSIAKGGIVCQLNARTSILAAANFVSSQWNRRENILNNIGMSSTLLSRFDLIFPIIDPNTREYDRSVMKHILSSYRYNNENDRIRGPIPEDLLRDYIEYAKLHYNPKQTDDSKEYLLRQYKLLRRECYKNGRIMIYPRNLESIIRLSEAHARMRFSNLVELPDAVEAVRIYRVSTSISPT